ncbi:hypothetical protein GLOIN_2v1775572 [Rhizophagus irregularis DAOM 181602=DAOM 197198]|uniref:Uncharacterized protein n=1 Tax=Rhizophagus irregularis (strain DAOM 181602 / DAOM 197198 / MUCL 43194) TaxID=747089 RepID=A0A2P4PZB2_RHIID|nr:hypothetical protein GLOIN_2v1775572 [Rhizophagus irregularis DAOM 181602=DAOM 197198]POG70708.1 hypothetical protein GLOIN_2v1775572 [Rhizophagus irregularis DAOM 181602=DAOM 197198]|eukprot:XP_025177574.1 hypothetical protein GLOIN_2v1775572 [Rhizophagus irregularis DAOM 181602=DAOM 197198]
MSFEETRETRRISTINQNSVGAPILEAIHAKYNADRVGNDLFIKYDGCAKEAIHRRLANLAEAHNPARITHAQQHWIGIEYIGIAIPESIRRNPNPQQASVAVIAQNNISNRPLYAIHWDANNNQIYYPYNWNTHLLLRCGWTL